MSRDESIPVQHAFRADLALFEILAYDEHTYGARVVFFFMAEVLSRQISAHRSFFSFSHTLFFLGSGYVADFPFSVIFEA